MSVWLALRSGVHVRDLPAAALEDALGPEGVPPRPQAPPSQIRRRRRRPRLPRILLCRDTHRLRNLGVQLCASADPEDGAVAGQVYPAFVP